MKGPPRRDTIIVAHITDCPTITVHAEKHYKVLIDLGSCYIITQVINLQKIEDCYKTPIQPTTAKLNTSDGSPM